MMVKFLVEKVMMSSFKFVVLERIYLNCILQAQYTKFKTMANP